MEELKLWCENLILSVIAILLIELLIPESMENKKYIKVISGIFLMFMVLNPFIEILNGKSDFNIKDYFTVVQGSDMAGKHVEKEDVLRFAIDKLGIKEQELKNTIMVGDRKFDAIAAKKFGLKAIAVTYGYAIQGEWDNIQVDYFAQTPQDIINYEG